MKISCIVPVYNNSETVQHVLEVLDRNPSIHEIIVVDDKSRDNSVELIEELLGDSRKIRFFKNEVNLGKGGGLVRGLKESRNKHVFFCDADLAKWRDEHVNAILDTYKTGRYDMVIGARTDDRNGGGKFGEFLSTVSGERVFKKKVIKPYYDLIASLGNGVEQITNFAHKDKKVKMVWNKDTGHILKFERGRPRQWVRAYAKEGYQLAKTDMLLKKQLVKTIRTAGIAAVVGGLLSFWFFSKDDSRADH